ncbi:MAG: hypothetical protein MMC33_000413 [Icmadophila ericetorum]|nr:hypothetical protein [Icmadophila ericetorum]
MSPSPSPPRRAILLQSHNPINPSSVNITLKSPAFENLPASTRKHPLFYLMLFEEARKAFFTKETSSSTNNGPLRFTPPSSSSIAKWQTLCLFLLQHSNLPLEIRARCHTLLSCSCGSETSILNNRLYHAQMALHLLYDCFQKDIKTFRDFGLDLTNNMARLILGDGDFSDSVARPCRKSWVNNHFHQDKEKNRKQASKLQILEARKQKNRFEFLIKLEAAAKKQSFWKSHKRDTILAALRGGLRYGRRHEEEGSPRSPSTGTGTGTLSEKEATLQSARLIRRAILANDIEWRLVSWPLGPLEPSEKNAANVGGLRGGLDGKDKNGDGDDWLGRVVAIRTFRT